MTVPIAVALREARESKHWTLDAAAEKAKIHKITLCLYENGKRKPSPKTLNKLAKIYGLDLSEYISEMILQPNSNIDLNDVEKELINAFRARNLKHFTQIASKVFATA